GLGQSAVNAIITARQNGPFKSFFDFAERIETGALNKRSLESLVSAGAFDSLKPSSRTSNEWRSALHSCIDPALARAQRAKRERLQGQNGLFGAVIADESPQKVPQAKGWTATVLLAAEKNALGFYITGHPLANYIDLLQSLKAAKS